MLHFMTKNCIFSKKNQKPDIKKRVQIQKYFNFGAKIEFFTEKISERYEFSRQKWLNSIPSKHLKYFNFYAKMGYD